MAETEGIDGFVNGWLGGTPAGELLIVSGAGVSANPPTALPLGWSLLERAFELLFEPAALRSILEIHEKVGVVLPGIAGERPRARPPRLETVLGVAVEVHGLERTMEVLADFHFAQPNALHSILAAHIMAGGVHITANFDDCIERADPRLPSSEASIWHFHGSLGVDPTGATLGATLRAIERGFAANDARFLRRMLSERNRLLVVGYSGSDFFDFDQALSELRHGELGGCSVLWVVHQPGPGWSTQGVQDTDPQPARLLDRSGAHMTMMHAHTATVVEAVARALSLDVFGGVSPVAPTGRPAVPLGSSPAADRARATLHLFRQLRLHSLVAPMVESPAVELSAVERFRTMADLLWESGRFASARRAWRRAPTGVPDWERQERMGACLDRGPWCGGNRG